MFAVFLELKFGQTNSIQLIFTKIKFPQLAPLFHYCRRGVKIQGFSQPNFQGPAWGHFQYFKFQVFKFTLFIFQFFKWNSKYSIFLRQLRHFSSHFSPFQLFKILAPNMCWLIFKDICMPRIQRG